LNLQLERLKEYSHSQLQETATSLGLKNDFSSERDFIFGIVNHITFSTESRVVCKGYVSLFQDGFAFLRFKENNYLPTQFDIYISPKQISVYSLRNGDEIDCVVGLPRSNERYFFASEIILVNGTKNEGFSRVRFDKLTPIYPNQRINLEIENESDSTLRIIDLVSPMGLGQRGLIVAPPKTGKTTIMQKLAKAIEINHPSCHLMVLLLDERPEEVTDMNRWLSTGEFVSSTFDEPAYRHIIVAEATIERAKRLVEAGKDVMILLDGITRLSRAYNTVTPSSGRVLTGGVDSNALQKPKSFFGAARNIEEGGSLTIIATALVETNSKMDEILFEEFKGTGNM
jgi:transcription termination factor Rho